MLTFPWVDTTPVRGPFTFTTPRALGNWRNDAESHLFVRKRDDQNKVKCLNIKAESIRHHLETGVEIKLDNPMAA
jgi:hypothetical protein